jgi:hypothetical protein
VHICAPSNAAIDEILTRINASGLIGLHHKRDKISKEFANVKFNDMNANSKRFYPSEE